MIVVEGLKELQFTIARVFTVIGPKGSIRGQHAHKKCTQFLSCPYGKVEVLCKDEMNSVIYTIENPQSGILIPPGIWAQQSYIFENTILNVFCDMPYEEQDYIRNFEEYKNYFNH